MRLRCGEERREVAVHPSRDGLEIVVGGSTAFRWRVLPVAPGTFLLFDGERREKFHCVRDGDEIHLLWRGVVYRLEEEREGRASAHRPPGGGLEAPMPGKVIAVRVAPGQRVAKGDELLVVEAMKMENALRAPRDGTVKAVSARVGEMVSPGAVLVELE